MREIGPSQIGKRLLLLAPLTIYFVAALILIAASVDARGAASVIEYAPETPTLAGIFFAVPPLLILPVLSRLVWLKTAETKFVAPSRLVIWVAGMAVGIALTIAYIASVGRESAYWNLDARGVPQPVFGNESSFLGLSLMLGVCEGIAIAVWSWYFGLRAFSEPQLEAVEGLDPMGEIMRSPS